MLLFFINTFAYRGNDFDKLAISPYNIAIGGCGTSEYFSPFSVVYNPGLYSMTKKISFGYGRYFNNAFWNNSFGYSMFRNREYLTLIYGYFSVENIPDTRSILIDQDNDNELTYIDSLDYNKIKMFSTSAHRFIFNYGRLHSNDLSYGINLKFYYRDLSIIKGVGFGVDLGVQYKYKNCILGFAVQNVVPTFIFWDNSNKEILYPQLRVGLNFRKKFSLNLKINYYLEVIDFFAKNSQSSMFSALYNNFAISNGISIEMFNFFKFSFGFNGELLDNYSRIKDYFYNNLSYGINIGYKKIQFSFSMNNNLFLDTSYNIEINYIF